MAGEPKRLPAPIHYPETDGEPMAENVDQYNWIVKVKTNLHVLLGNDFVAGDLFWYPVEGDPTIRRAPDVMVALGRPPGSRSSFLQWEEGGRGPEVVIEVWSPGNRFREMIEKFRFYETYGVQELITWDSDGQNLVVHVRRGNELQPVNTTGGWTSPLLGVTFDGDGETLVIRDANGRPFEEAEEILRRADRETARAEAASKRAEDERVRAEEANQRAMVERARAEEANQRVEALLAQLRALGVSPA